MTHDYREICSCGHAKATHFHGPPTTKRASGPYGLTVSLHSNPCLGLACDCKHYEIPNEKEQRHADRDRYIRPT